MRVALRPTFGRLLNSCWFLVRLARGGTFWLTLAMLLVGFLILAACQPQPEPPIDWDKEYCPPATGAGQCNLPGYESSCICGWPPFWERGR